MPHDQETNEHGQPKQSVEVAETRQAGEHPRRQVPSLTATAFGAVECPERHQAEDRDCYVIAIDAGTVQEQNPRTVSIPRYSHHQHQPDSQCGYAIASCLTPD